MPVSEPRGPINGIVRDFDDDEGWGCTYSSETPRGCFVHFSHIKRTDPS